MKKGLLIAALLSLASWAGAQPYGNEWIHYDRQYWYFQIWQDGMRKIDSTALANAGFPVATVDPRTIQLYARGRQVPIHVEGEQDGVFNTTDYIEFYGAKNDAWLDSTLWDDPAHINNPYYSLYNDTIRYYLTWDPGSEAKRTIESGSTNWAAYTPLTWSWATTFINTIGIYQTGKRTSLGASTSMINEAEGYFHSVNIEASGADMTRNYALAVPDLYTGTDAPHSTFRLVLASLNNSGGNNYPDHHLRVAHAGTVLTDTIFNGYGLLKYTYQFAPSTMTMPTTSVDATAVYGLPDLPTGYKDAFAPAWYSIRYPRGFVIPVVVDLEIPGQTAPDSTVIAFISVPNTVVYAWAADGLHRVKPSNSSSNIFQAVLPPNTQDMRVNVTRAYNIAPIGPMAPVNGTGTFPDPGLDLSDSALVIVTHPTLMSAAAQYASYRETNAHNRYNTVLADVEQLYDQFGGGVRQHPLAIRNYLRYVYDHAPSHPQALFLIGKSVRAPATGGLPYDKGYRKDPLASAACLVPTIGWPNSDILFGLNLSGTQPTYLSVPVGRLAAKNPTEVLDYLAKVDSVESQSPAAWMKNILHFRGGNTSWEYAQFGSALESFRVLAEDSSFFGHVTRFNKSGSGIIEQAAVDSVHDLIANGVTLMTFFAHAFGAGFDITIDNPVNYDWHGKFPTMIGNSCYTGNIHLYDASSASEQFVLHHNAGAVAFLSTVDVGISTYLRDYTRDFYKSFSQVNYGKTIGEHMRFAVQDQLSQGTIESLNSAETMTLHGDPTLVMNSPKLADLEVTQADVTTIPQQVTADVDSFQVRVVFRNNGRGTHQPFSVALERTLSSEGLTLPPVLQQVSMTSYQDTVIFTLPTAAGNSGQGLNELRVRIDLDPDLIPEEEEEANNKATIQINIHSGDLLPVDPYDFAILSDNAPMLKASTGDPFAPPRNYIFQIDTTDLYNSPVMEQHTLTAPGGVVQWQPTSIYAQTNGQDSTVYFWRCALDSAGQGNYNWHEFSFQHINGRQGWGQAHFFQFKNDDFNLIGYDRPTRNFTYPSSNHQIACEVRGANYIQCSWTKDIYQQEGQGCGPYPSMNVSVVDPFDFTTWMTLYNGVGRDYGQKNKNGACKDRQEGSFIFYCNNPTMMESMANMLSNEIPDGYYVLVHTYLYLTRSVLDASNALPVLQELGAANLANGTVQDSVPYIFFCRKGDPTSIQEVWGDSIDALINMTAHMQLNPRSGSILAPRSNHALSWESLSWKLRPLQPYDSSRVQLMGVTPQLAEQPLLDLSGPTGDIDLQPFLTAQQFPQLRLKGRFWNDSLNVQYPSQLRRWQLLGTPAPECALDPPAGYYVHMDSIFQGQQGEVMVTVRNIGQVPMDSLLMAAWVSDHTNQSHLVHYKYNAPLPVGAVLQDTIRFDTQQFPGPNSIRIEANPVDTLTQFYDQPEQYHFNNIAVLRFFTQQDIENPVLDVTFDGIHILDGDIVSAKPEIQVTLDDENQALLLNEPSDTAFFKVFLTDPSGTVKRIWFREGGQEILQFVPANGPANVSKVFYRPNFTQDGKYQLTVRASDKSRNNSGDRDNSVQFEVINRPTLTEVLNYPNPFTTSTRFVFTLTGHEVPTAMRIQIMTISGRVVREVPMSEMGPMHVGRNITDFAWDGTDQFGDRLARGVYLYRVMAQLHGEDIEYRDGGAGSFFKKGFGKMYLLR
ncbi:MAG TPA: C25 family cysteine peptidase [Flavobacteriales bacterium]|nr:C25 family cysteine peptidase [Flavobacteriales bacterium]HQW32579.1 C25 family cysteine peptidase [Flavobacteriales bacterium]HQY03163.1 C25 family cysteine peptidase [Flavobacteriales bacterium]HQY80095.1 C25 family cysteine peptidase [Flavobacteriales bacterium]HRA16149.1 C25 family cysteine peptidase [Flavobacteriales bacterium]